MSKLKTKKLFFQKTFQIGILRDENIVEAFEGLGLVISTAGMSFPIPLHGKLGRNNWQSQKAKAKAHVLSGGVSSRHIPSTAKSTFQLSLLTSECFTNLFFTLQIKAPHH